MHLGKNESMNRRQKTPVPSRNARRQAGYVITGAVIWGNDGGGLDEWENICLCFIL